MAQEPERVMAGGNGSGKTFVGVREARLFALGEHPHRSDIQAPNAGWIVSPTFNMSQEIIEPYLGIRPDPGITPIFPPGYGEWSASRRVFRLPNGSTIGLMSCDAGALRFQGPKRRWVMFDEEPELEVYQEAGARLVPGQRLDRWICETPTRGLSWTYDDFVLHPVAGRHVIIYAELASNPAVTEDQVKEVEERYSRDPLKVARMSGHFTVVGLRPAFQIQPLQVWLARANMHPAETGYLTTDAIFEPQAEGEFTVWERPRASLRYAVGADIAEGLTGGAYSVAHVLRMPDRAQVAEWRGHMAPIPFGRMLARIGRYYNDALVNPEANNHGHATIAELTEECGYTNVYRRRTIDREVPIGMEASTFGYFTTRQNKDVLEEMIRESIAQGDELRSPVLLRELMGASRDVLGNMVAGRGLHTDCIMARGLALVASREMRYDGWPAGSFEPDTLDWWREKAQEQRAEREAADQARAWGFGG